MPSFLRISRAIQSESACFLSRSCSSARTLSSQCACSSDQPPIDEGGMRFLGLKVAGHRNIHDNVPPNTKVEISGLGTLWLHRVIQTDSYIEVRMIELVVTQKNTFGIAVGTDVRVANAHTSLDTNHR